MSYMPILPVPYICWRAVRVRVVRAARRLGVDASELIRGSDEELDEAIIYFAVENRLSLDWLITGDPATSGDYLGKGKKTVGRE